jgi:hypothetical protein
VQGGIKRVAGMNSPCNLISGIRNLTSVLWLLVTGSWSLVSWWKGQKDIGFKGSGSFKKIVNLMEEQSAVVKINI